VSDYRIALPRKVSVGRQFTVKIRPARRPPGRVGFLPVNCQPGETFLGERSYNGKTFHKAGDILIRMGDIPNPWLSLPWRIFHRVNILMWHRQASWRQTDDDDSIYRTRFICMQKRSLNGSLPTRLEYAVFIMITSSRTALIILNLCWNNNRMNRFGVSKKVVKCSFYIMIAFEAICPIFSCCIIYFTLITYDEKILISTAEENYLDAGHVPSEQNSDLRSLDKQWRWIPCKSRLTVVIAL